MSSDGRADDRVPLRSRTIPNPKAYKSRGAKMIACLRVLTIVGALMLSACSSTFSKTWRDPKATPLEFKGQKVAAVVLVKDESLRRLAENRLAQQIAARGAQGRPMYSLAPNALYGDEQGTRAALEREGVKGVIVMRPVKVDKTVK